MEINEALVEKLARLEHLLSRNSGNSSSPLRAMTTREAARRRRSKRRRAGPERPRGKQPGAPGSNLAWSEDPHERLDRFPRGRCGCGADLAGALGISGWSLYQDQRSRRSRCGSPSTTRQVACGCGRTPHRRPPRRGPAGPVGYGPNLAAFAVYLMVVHFVPAHRVVALLESLTGAAPSVGFVHGLLARTAGLLGGVHDRIRTLITLAYAVCCR